MVDIIKLISIEILGKVFKTTTRDTSYDHNKIFNWLNFFDIAKVLLSISK